MTFGQWLKQRRKALDLTQGELARLVGYSVWTIVKIEAGLRRPSRQITELLATYLELTPDQQDLMVKWARMQPGSADLGPDQAAPVIVRPPPIFGHPPINRAPSFTIGPPIRDPRYFFGRTFELTRIFALWQQFPLQNIAIIGPRRSGKTSLLHHLMTISTTDPALLRPDQRADWLPQPRRYRWAFVDFQDVRMRRRERLLRHLLACLDLPAAEPCDLEQFMDIVSSRLHTPALILLDELGAALASPELDLPFWESLRSLANHYTNGNLGFVLAAHEQPAHLALADQQTSPFFNIFGHTFMLGPLAEHEARALIASAPAAFDPADVEWILAHSGRWPCLLQILCYARLATIGDPSMALAWRAHGLQQLVPFRHLLDPQ